MKNSEIQTIAISLPNFQESYQLIYSKQVIFACKSYKKLAGLLFPSL